jgi:hypothetical protein
MAFLFTVWYSEMVAALLALTTFSADAAQAQVYQDDVVNATGGVTPNVTASAHPDIIAVLNVTGNVTPGVTWADSYSVGHNCYCASTFDHNVGSYYVDTPLGWLTVREVCDLLGPGPGISGNPVYNDIQCGNGPPNDAGDEHVCPGRTDIGVEGCGHIGPKWNFASYITSSPTVLTTTAAPSASASVSPTMKLSLVPSHSPSSTLSSDSSSLSPTNYPLDSPLSPPSMLPSDSPSYATPIGSDSPLLPSTPTSGGHEQFRYISLSSIVIASLLSVATVLSS